ncbi:MAG: hypothetical protein UT48_C0006G0006 [Parcubacteria group bacterium GW2011_GWE2_39_37]|uniref:Aspartate kinase n=1 Tax=Candidatus Falkowbacteria bacterium GW2011_GWF2_39_8 TaxID=1618642 RepID=A0A0G0T7N5_9BACT|nr:MAG: hypothetical protein UT48_C0006G0006 [Parcubacteria group bacterium GW2011_GWE2_39_37]KKR33867.1 MAG: hypothetical protein UT64_C0002G0006 [Candidatus Falkowbacteria bacterium GW2011_GWF2_39_8]
MKKISDSLLETINNNTFIQFGFYHHLFNLTQLANFIRPLVQIKTKKDLKSSSALVMALSRLQKEKAKKILKMEHYKIKNLTIYSRLITLTYSRTQEVVNKIDQIYNEIQKNNGYIALTQGTNELTIIINDESEAIVKKQIKDQPINVARNLGAVCIKFEKKYYDTPGLLYYLLQQVFLQGVSIREITSTFTEVIIYVDQKNVKLIFDTFYNQF